jgi:excinuclease ABC subunit C
LVEPAEYAEDVRHSVMFLEGRSNALTDELSGAMEQAASTLDFERAAELRDQISLLRRVQDQQSMEGGTGDVDVIAAFVNPGGACVHLISVRGGRVLGSKNFFPQTGIDEDVAEVMAAFLGQYYVSSPERDLPSELIVNVVHEDFPTLIEAIHELRGRELDISHRVRGTRARWQQLAVTNAEQDQVGHCQFVEHVTRHGQLALATVHQQDIREFALTVLKLAETPGQGLVHGRVVIAGSDAFDVVAPVIGFDRPFRTKHHARRHGGLAAGVTDVVALQALRRFVQVEDFGQAALSA